MGRKKIVTLKKYMVQIFIISSLILIPLFGFSQDGPAPFLPDKPEQSPIDGGLTVLAVLGGGYAIKKLRDKNKE